MPKIKKQSTRQTNIREKKSFMDITFDFITPFTQRRPITIVLNYTLLLVIVGTGINAFLFVRHLADTDTNGIIFAWQNFVYLIFNVFFWIAYGMSKLGALPEYTRINPDASQWKIIAAQAGLALIATGIVDLIFAFIVKIVPAAIIQAEIYFYFVSTGIAEEVFFRGFLQDVIIYSMMNKYPKYVMQTKIIGLGITSIIFMFFHIVAYGNEPVYLISTLFSGLTFGFFYIYSKGNLFVPIISHVTVNVIAAFKIAPQYPVNTIFNNSSVSPVLIVLLLIFLCIPIILFSMMNDITNDVSKQESNEIIDKKKSRIFRIMILVCVLIIIFLLILFGTMSGLPTFGIPGEI